MSDCTQGPLDQARLVALAHQATVVAGEGLDRLDLGLAMPECWTQVGLHLSVAVQALRSVLDLIPLIEGGRQQ